MYLHIKYIHLSMSNKITKTFRFSEETIKQLELIAKHEKRSLTNALEYMISEKADFYKIVVEKQKEKPSGAFKSIITTK